ncbi:cation transporter [Salinarchaeum sp. Harcht-Bsk1]|nr:cation transporter [Salinarchaeum sp. Harcht-Bsk1]
MALTGTVCKYLAITMVVPLLTAIVYGGDLLVFVGTMTLTVGIGLLLERIEPQPDLGAREATLLVTIVWFVVAVVGAIPFVLAGWGTESTLAHPVNALFESMSGFTTTGATVMGDISFDQHSRALLMWRQLMQWLGGMGIIVLMVAILPELAINGSQLLQAEAPGPELQKLTPKIAETARVLWLVYFGFTIVYVALLYSLHLLGFAPDMTFYMALSHGFTTLPTGGFSPEADSIAAFSAAVQWVVIPFMVVAGTNFALFWATIGRNRRALVEDTEFRAYAGAIAVFSALASATLYLGTAPPLGALGGVTEGIAGDALRHGTFQIASLLTSTGYATSDFASWGPAGQMTLLIAMFVGGSAGSTGGGIKVIRWVIALRAVRRELVTSAHPDAVQPVRLRGRVVDEDAVRGVLVFTFLYIFVFGIATLLLTLDAARIGYELNGYEAISASLATLGNIGPGFGSLGPFGSYLEFPWTSKLLMVFLMWFGRLEIIPVLLVFSGSFWNR